MKKLPLGLGLACMMMLSSCSKEDVQVAEPEVGSVNESSGMREGANGIELLTPHFAPTLGPAGLGIYASEWQRRNDLYSSNLQKLPTGTSNASHLWGNPSLPWSKAMPELFFEHPGSILTVTTMTTDLYNKNERSAVTTQIKNLKQGKKYAINFKVASTLRNVRMSPLLPVYAKEVHVVLGFPNGSSSSHYVDLAGKHAEWVSKTVIFTAHAGEARFSFSAITEAQSQYAYAHIFVDKNSIKQVN